jgi:hypothetical protein
LNLGAEDVLLQEARQNAEAAVVATAEENGILGSAEKSTGDFVTT